MKNLIFFGLLGIMLSCPSDKQNSKLIEKGVSKALSENRKENISNISYDIYFVIPESKQDSIKGFETIHFETKKAHDIILDFTVLNQIRSISIHGKPIAFQKQNEHIIIDEKFVKAGLNSISIEFIAGNQSLNRNDEFLYTLFVPDRARTAFPCFDQPNLKAKFNLELEIPKKWKAVANGKLIETKEKEESVSYKFDTTKPLSTYLFSFVAGKFEIITKKHKNQQINLYHRETNLSKIENNVDEIYRILFESLDWLENYTDVDYPFAKYDLIAIPSFQYGGMEHTGATLYRASKLFLDENPSVNELLDRATLIAHETAHMWFGDLVTMDWFDDVWMKEVFANLMADKIVQPAFPNINHELGFLLDHYPKAYSIDRTSGANPIGQDLDNLNTAGTLYGAIIYHKSPIMMRMLEEKMGSSAFQKGIQQYVKTYTYDNSNWNQLIEILDPLCDEDLKTWSNVWVYTPGYPEISLSKKENSIEISQNNKNQTKIWNQELHAKNMNSDEEISIPFIQKSVETKLKVDNNSVYILPNAHGKAYGLFKMEQTDFEWIQNNYNIEIPALQRGTILLNCYENLLHGNIGIKQYYKFLINAIQIETEKLNINTILSQLNEVHWNFLNEGDRQKWQVNTEDILWDLIVHTKDQGIKRNLYNNWLTICNSKKGLDKLIKVWNKEISISGLKLSENDFINLCYQLCLKDENNYKKYTQTEKSRIKNPDTRKKFEFIIQALNPDENQRDKFFNKLKKEENRAIEPWVNSSLYYLHHPLRTKHSVKYLKSSLELLKEIQETGDIFFPYSWLKASFSRHNSNEANQIVENFLKENPNYSANLKLKILQTTDKLKRYNTIMKQ